MEYVNLERYVNLVRFDSLSEEIITALVESKHLAIYGTWSRQLVDDTLTSKPKGVKLLSEAMTEFMALPDNDPTKVKGIELYRNNFNVFGTYLKNALKAYDPYHYYTVFGNVREEDQPLLKYMPNFLLWLREDLKNSVFTHITKVTFIVCDANGISWDHKDLDCNSEFIYLRFNTEKPAYLWDPVTRTKQYINSRAAHWDPNVWFGEEQVVNQSLAIRIEGEFTESLKYKIKNDI